jgi:hypothetical protein
MTLMQLYVFACELVQEPQLGPGLAFQEYCGCRCC